MRIDDLIKAAQTGIKEKPSILNDVQQFVKELKIKEGARKVKSVLMYKAYCSWSAKPVSRTQFSTQLTQLLTAKSHDLTHNYYLINYRPIELLNKIDNMKVKI